MTSIKSNPTSNKTSWRELPIVSGRDSGLRFLQRLSLVAIFAAFVLPLLGVADEGGYSICWLYNSFRLPCPGCGLTRSVVSFYHLEFYKSWYYNPFGVGISFVFFSLSVSGFSHRFSRWLIKNSQIFKKVFLVYFLLLAFAGVVRILIQIYAPELLGPYAIVNTEKILLDYPFSKTILNFF